MKAIYFMIMLLYSLHLVSCACHIAALSKADSCDVRCKDLALEVVSLGRLNALQTKILGLGKVKIVTRRSVTVFNPETLYAGRTALLGYAKEKNNAMQKKIIFTSSKGH